MPDQSIRVKELTKTFKIDIVLNNINIEFEAGKIHVILGKNSSGKTMLLKCICGFVIPSKGQIFVGEQQISKDVDVPYSMWAIIEAP